MLRLRSLNLFTLALVCMAGLPGSMVAQQTSAAPTRLALEVTYYPGRTPLYETVPGRDAKPSGGWFPVFGRIASWRPGPGAAVIKAVGVVSHVEEDGVRVTVSLWLGEKALENEQPVASYLIRENEKISAEELRQFGIEPFGIKLMRVAPTLIAAPPVIFKGVTSIVVLNAAVVDATLPVYQMTLFNQSTKNIVALAIYVVTGDKIEGGGIVLEPYGAPLILAGKNYEFQKRAPTRARETPGGFEPTSLANPNILIRTAVFDDGTYEGEAESAAAVRAFRAGEKMELPRLMAVLDKALNLQVTDVTEALRSLEKRVASVSSDADPDLVQGLASEFPQLGKPATGRIKDAMEVSATGAKTDLLKEIRKVETEASQTLNPNSYREWLSRTKERCAQWLARL